MVQRLRSGRAECPRFRIGVVLEEVPDEEFAAQVWITGSQDGWFRIRAAASGAPDTHRDEAPVFFEGEGLVSGGLLGLAVEGRHLYREPSPGADKVVDLFDGGDGCVVMDRLLACDGQWAQGEFSLRGRTLRGWASDICSSQLTTSP